MCVCVCVCQVPGGGEVGGGSIPLEATRAGRPDGARWTGTVPGTHDGPSASPRPLHEFHVRVCGVVWWWWWWWWRRACVSLRKAGIESGAYDHNLTTNITL